MLSSRRGLGIYPRPSSNHEPLPNQERLPRCSYANVDGNTNTKKQCRWKYKYKGILVVSGFALFFALFHICPIFCPHFLPLPLPSFFVEGKGKGKKWGQNIGQMWKRAKLKAKLEGKNIRGRGQNTGQKCEFIWNNSWAPKTPNIKTTELIWTDCTFPTFIWSLLSLFKFEKKNARQWN